MKFLVYQFVEVDRDTPEEAALAALEAWLDPTANQRTVQVLGENGTLVDIIIEDDEIRRVGG